MDKLIKVPTLDETGITELRRVSEMPGWKIITDAIGESIATGQRVLAETNFDSIETFRNIQHQLQVLREVEKFFEHANIKYELDKQSREFEQELD